jgi:ribosome-binding factor A
LRSHRLKRTDDLIRRIVSEAILTKLQDPRIGLVTVTGVEVSREYDTAKVWVSVYGDEKARADSLAGLRSAAAFLQSEISREVRMRRIPRLRFLYDDSIERGMRIDATLREVGEAEAPAPEGEESDDPGSR